MVRENHFSCSHYDKKRVCKELELFKIFDFNRSFRIYEGISQPRNPMKFQIHGNPVFIDLLNPNTDKVTFIRNFNLEEKITRREKKIRDYRVGKVYELNKPLFPSSLFLFFSSIQQTNLLNLFSNFAMLNN